MARRSMLELEMAGGHLVHMYESGRRVLAQMVLTSYVGPGTLASLVVR